MNYTSENLCVCFLCFMLGYLFCQNMRGTEGLEGILKSDKGQDDFMPGVCAPDRMGCGLSSAHIEEGMTANMRINRLM